LANEYDIPIRFDDIQEKKRDIFTPNAAVNLSSSAHDFYKKNNAPMVRAASR
jgi:hypothetical protein